MDAVPSIVSVLPVPVPGRGAMGRGALAVGRGALALPQHCPALPLPWGHPHTLSLLAGAWTAWTLSRSSYLRSSRPGRKNTTRSLTVSTSPAASTR